MCADVCDLCWFLRRLWYWWPRHHQPKIIFIVYWLVLRLWSVSCDEHYTFDPFSWEINMILFIFYSFCFLFFYLKFTTRIWQCFFTPLRTINRRKEITVMDCLYIVVIIKYITAGRYIKIIEITIFTFFMSETAKYRTKCIKSWHLVFK
jgi:hypothetical protein